jgi:hypothetical protein
MENTRLLTSLAAENAIPEYTYLSTTNVTPLLMYDFILGLQTKWINFKQNTNINILKCHIQYNL